MSPRSRVALAGGLVVLALGLGGCSAIEGLFGGPNVSRDAESQEVVEAGTADVFTMRVGDCFDDVAADEVSDVPAVPCGEPHDNEVYYEFSMTGDEWPGQEAIDAEAQAQCGPQFDTFVGLSYEESVLNWFPFTPTQGSWDEMGDRVVQCVVYEPDTKVQGSLAGVAR
jgi:hypothetical protein